MKTVSVREFSYNPSAMFAQVERGATIEVTRHGKVIAVLKPPEAKPKSRVDELIEQGLVIPAQGDGVIRWDEFRGVEVPDDVDPVAVLLELRRDER